MDLNEFDKIVRLAKAAFDANLKAKEAYKAYATAASAAYTELAASAAQTAYELSVNSNNFEHSLINKINQDFRTNFSVNPAQTSASIPPPTQTPIPQVQVQQAQTPTPGVTPIASPSVTNAVPEIEVVQPYKELFASEEEIIKSKDEGRR